MADRGGRRGGLRRVGTACGWAAGWPRCWPATGSRARAGHRCWSSTWPNTATRRRPGRTCRPRRSWSARCWCSRDPRPRRPGRGGGCGGTARPPRRLAVAGQARRPGRVTCGTRRPASRRRGCGRPWPDTPPTQIVAADRGVALGLALPGPAPWSTPRGDGSGILVVFTSRTGKTTAVAVPAMLTAPGAVVVTSNKADTLLLDRGAARPRHQAAGVGVRPAAHRAHRADVVVEPTGRRRCPSTT